MPETEAKAAPEGASSDPPASRAPTPHEAGGARVPLLARRPGRIYWIIPAVAAVEILGQGVIQSRVADQDDWRDALEHVRAEWQPSDTLVAAPRWSSPLMREAAGSLLDRPRAGASDLAAYDRLWVVSIRGARAEEAPDEAPDESLDFGRVRVERFALPTPTVLYDFTEHVGEARVTRTENGAPIPCPITNAPGSSYGGLAAGPYEGAPRHVCDPRRPWLTVFATTTVDLELRGRRCVSQHAAGPEPITTSYDDVPLGRSVVLYGGIWWERERWRNGADVHVVVRLDGEEIGRMTHRDGDGWKRMEASIPSERVGGRGRVSVDVSAPDQEFRAFCWSASTRGER